MYESGLHFPWAPAVGNLRLPLQWKQADQLIWPGNNIHPNLPGRGIILQAGGQKQLSSHQPAYYFCVHDRVVVVCDVWGNSAARLLKTAVWFWLEVSLFCSVKAVLICVVGWTYFKDSLYDTKPLLILLQKSYFLTPLVFTVFETGDFPVTYANLS